MIKMITSETTKDEAVEILEGLTGSLGSGIYELELSAIKKIIDTIAYYKELL